MSTVLLVPLYCMYCVLQVCLSTVLLVPLYCMY